MLTPGSRGWYDSVCLKAVVANKVGIKTSQCISSEASFLPPTPPLASVLTFFMGDDYET